MHLIMFDLDGTLLRSNTADAHCFSGAFRSVLGIENFNSDWSDFAYVTDEGIVAEMLARHLKRPATQDEKSIVRAKIIQLLREMIVSDANHCGAIPGAIELFGSLGKMPGCTVAIATGCWRESALLKLTAAGFDVERVPMASADDSHRREDIMRKAHERALDFRGEREFKTVTYVGDGIWDLRASRTMGYHFIGIGYYGNGTRLRAEGAPFVFSDFGDRKAFLTRLEKIWGS